MNIRGFESRRKFESLLQNELAYGIEAGRLSLDEDETNPNEEIDLADDDNHHFKSILIEQQPSRGTVDESAMFYSMMSESMMVNNGAKTLPHQTIDPSMTESVVENNPDSDKCFDDEDRNQVRFARK